MLPSLRYNIDDLPPFWSNLMFGLQWFIIAVISAIILGKVVAGMHSAHLGFQVMYLQKLFFFMGLAMLVQVLWGHGLPLVAGPSAALMVGIVAGMGRGIDAIYTGIALGGFFLLLLNLTGIFARLTRLFTFRVVACILILIALSITPVIMNLISCPVSSNMAEAGPLQLGGALILLLLMLAADQRLKGVWKTTMLVWAILFGSFALHYFVPPESSKMSGQLHSTNYFFKELVISPTWDTGVILAFLICVIALAVNDLGSMHAVGRLVGASDMESRVRKGIFVTGLCNFFAGGFGIIGPVNFSLSAGIIASNGNGSRFSLIPAAVGMICMAFFPCLLGMMWAVPGPVVGTVLFYVMSAQLSAGFMTAFGGKSFSFEDGMIIGVPSMICIVISYLPQGVKESFPDMLMPIFGNGFVVGALVVMILEHLVYGNRTDASGSNDRGKASGGSGCYR